MQQVKRSFSRTLGVAAGVATLAGAPLMLATGCEPSTPCRSVAFAPNSDWLATDLTAASSSCTTAQAVARDGKTGPSAFNSHGFHCVGRAAKTQSLPYVIYACKGASGASLSWKLVGAGH